MIVRAADGSVVIDEAEDLDRLRVETDLSLGLLDRELRSRGAGHVIDDDSAAIAPAFLAVHARPRAIEAGGRDHVHAMVDDARRNGWLTEDGGLVAHVVGVA